MINSPPPILKYLLIPAAYVLSSLPTFGDPVIAKAVPKEKPYTGIELVTPEKPSIPLIPTRTPIPERRVPAEPKIVQDWPTDISSLFFDDTVPDFDDLDFSAIPETGEFLTLSQKRKYFNMLEGFDNGRHEFELEFEAIIGTYMLTMDGLYTTDNFLMKAKPSKWLITKGVNLGEAGKEILPIFAKGAEAITRYNPLAWGDNFKFYNRIPDRMAGYNDLKPKPLHPFAYRLLPKLVTNLIDNPPDGFFDIQLNVSSRVNDVRVRDVWITLGRIETPVYKVEFGLFKNFNESSSLNYTDDLPLTPHHALFPK